MDVSSGTNGTNGTNAANAASPAIERCGVCGAAGPHTDAARPPGGGWLLLAECPHCDHRWTRPLPAPARPAVRIAAPAPSEVASAA